MRRHRRKTALFILVAVFLTGCGRRGPETPDETGGLVPVAAAPAREANDAGRFLAGLAGRAGSPFAKWESSEAWATHRRELDRAWILMDSRWLPPIRAFQKKELETRGLSQGVVFYPFSGPDALMMTTLFPRNPAYVMIGLEPAGTLPRADRVPDEQLGAHLAGVRDAISSVLQRSFFITHEMDRDFRGQVTDGLFSPILLLLARSGHTIVGFRYVQIDERGNLVERNSRRAETSKHTNAGVQIDFRTGERGAVQRLVYLSANLSDERLGGNTGLRAFLARLRGVATFFKATSYLPHHKDFSAIRGFVLAGSRAVLQDDSGIPFRFLNGDGWRVTLFGAYDRPYGSFAWLEQPDLREAYRRPDVKAMDFHIGYGFSRVPSNLQLAERGAGASSGR